MKRPIAWSVLQLGDDDFATRARWLERAMTGLTFGNVVGEFSALRGLEPTIEGEPAESVRKWLGPQAGLVLEEGLGCLPRQKLAELCNRPELLVGLQELVLTEGGRHWMRLVNEADGIDEIAKRHKHVILGHLAQGAGGHGGKSVVAPVVAQTALQHATPATGACERDTPSSNMQRRLFRGFFVVASLATAAAIATFVVVAQRDRGPSGGEEVVSDGKSDVMIVSVGVPQAPAKPARGEENHGDEQVVETRRENKSVNGSPPPKALESLAGTKPNWPTHPWQTGGPALEGDRIRQTSGSIGLVTAAREWSSKLRDADELSAEQVRSAVTRARDAVKSLDAILESERIELALDARTTVRAKCRAATAELDQLHSAMPAGPAVSADSVLEAKVRLVQVLEELERSLDEGVTNSGPKSNTK